MEYADEASATVAKEALHNFKIDGETKMKVSLSAVLHHGRVVLLKRSFVVHRYRTQRSRWFPLRCSCMELDVLAWHGAR